MFIASLVGDIVRGMCYLHESVIKCHGNLKSSNCLIDSRWVLKIADFGLRDLKDKKDDDPYYMLQEVEIYISLYFTFDFCLESIQM